MWKTFLPRIFFDVNWMITESVSITKIKAMNGRIKTVLVSMAITPRVAPSEIEPVSPM